MKQQNMIEMQKVDSEKNKMYLENFLFVSLLPIDVPV